MRFVALDGDTQTTARNVADGMQPGLFDKKKIKVVIIHGVPEDQAQQIFADCNSQGVKVSTSMAIGLDNRDDATQLSKLIEKSVPALHGKVNRQKRQLGSKELDLITMSALRASVVCFIEGIGGVQNQTKTVDIDFDDQERYRIAGALWYAAVVAAMGDALQPENRAATFAVAPAVWCAIGAIGHDVLETLQGEEGQPFPSEHQLESRFLQVAQEKFANFDWQRGDRWLVMGAKRSSSGSVTLGGPKETGSLVYKALKDGGALTPAVSA